MVKVAGYLEKRGPGFVAVVEVPPAKRAAVGAKRLKKGLSTRDKHVAEARLPKALLELHARIDEACRRRPETDPLTAEAMAFREQLQGVRAGGRVCIPSTVFDPDTGCEEEIEVEIAGDILVDEVQARGEAIQREQGSERAKGFADIAFGRATPLLHHMETWLAEPGKRGTLRAPRTIREYRGMLEAFRDWLAEQGLASPTLFGKVKNAGLRDLMLLSLLSGMRINEACCLTVSQCMDDVFDVSGTKTRAAKRKVPIHPALSILIERRTDESRMTGCSPKPESRTATGSADRT
ncbi:hypothetical protein [Bosea sp. ASV33]|uniref:hypothetical protein n=1 Tax=Bosea sp. ASV33 TaxID=2795106 RepID=UPI0018EAA55F|nr:hypothetical protein [Bosea sp. ASV33]